MKKIRLKKKVIVIPIVFLVICFLMLGLYGFSLTSVSKNNEIVNFTVQSGASKISIVNDLKTAGLIRSKTALLIYLYFNSDLNLQAGKYELNRNMDANTILKTITEGNVKMETVKFTFVEGKNMNDFAKLISDNFSYTIEEVKEVLASKEFTKELIQKYDFLTDEVLNGNIYYALEGYLYPDTYEVMENASIKEIIMKMLDNTSAKLSSLNVNLEESQYTIHEILTMASIVELEGSNNEDRASFAQVIYKRLEMGMTLGMDTTTYYAVQKSRSEGLTSNDLASVNPYNTRTTSGSMAGKLPVGPIGNPSIDAIKAVLNPSDTDYVYFVANTCTGETFFTKELAEHLKKSRELKEICATN